MENTTNTTTTTEKDELFKLKVQVAQAIGQLHSHIKWAKLWNVKDETVSGLKNVHELLCLAMNHPDWIDELKEEEDAFIKKCN